MTSSDDTFSNRPFEQLDRLLKRKTETPSSACKPSKPTQTLSNKETNDVKSERQLFLDAVRDVTPIQKNNRSVQPNRPRAKNRQSVVEDAQEPCEKLERLIASGEGFVISQTPEYMEGTGHHVPPIITQHLHKGRFSIQDHIDLHGMDAAGALETLEGFLQKSISDGLRSVLVIHGRGLSSPGDPVLKTKLRQLLISNRWRKWILAFSSARSCDGGAGATYVLLRKKPLSKKKRKNPNPEETFFDDHASR